jgi:3-hydroxyacyl-[acyl-carrier-protein] dehydratase
MSTQEVATTAPSRLLFDLASIDLSAVAISADDVGRINPQCGDMRHLDHIIWHNQNFTMGLGVKYVRHDEFWVPGHIPGRPLLPGVIMIEAAAQLCSVISKGKSNDQRFLGFTRCDNVVFRGQVVPGDTLYLLVKEQSHKPRRFVSATQGVVDGKLVFEATITGMAM